MAWPSLYVKKGHQVFSLSPSKAYKSLGTKSVAMGLNNRISLEGAVSTTGQGESLYRGLLAVRIAEKWSHLANSNHSVLFGLIKPFYEAFNSN